jgi:hypothetical protein
LPALGKRSIDQRLKTTRQIRPVARTSGGRDAAETAGFRAPMRSRPVRRAPRPTGIQG